MAIISRAPKYSPNEVLEILTRLSRHESANITLFNALARRVGQSAEEFFPTQIVEVTRLFRSLGYADAALWSAIAGRSDDVLGTASPKRLVEFLEFVGDLQLPLRDPAIWSVARPSILAVLPHIRGGLGTVMESLAAHGCQDDYVVDALMAQARVLFRGEELPLSIFARVVESYGIMRPLEVDGFEKNCEAIKGYSGEGGKTDSPSDWLMLAAASKRIGNDDMHKHCIGQMNVLRKRSEGNGHEEKMGMVRLGHVAARINYYDAKFTEDFENTLEQTMTAEPQYIHSKLVFAFASLASLPSCSGDVISALLEYDAIKGAIKELPSPHLLSLLYASSLAGIPKDNQLIDDIANVLTLTASSFDLRQRRILWLAGHNMNAFHHLPIPSALPARMPWNAADLECETIGAFQLPRNDEGKLVLYEPRSIDGPRTELMKRILKEECEEEISVESMLYCCF